MTAAEIPAPERGWVMACRCGVPVALGRETFFAACLVAVGHLQTCKTAGQRTVEEAIVLVVDTLLWTDPDYYHQYRNLLHDAREQAARASAPVVYQPSRCGSCG